MNHPLVTAWYRWVPAKKPTAENPGQFEFNHLEEGHAVTATPADPFKRNWTKGRWARQHAQMVPGTWPGVLKVEPLCDMEVDMAHILKTAPVVHVQHPA